MEEREERSRNSDTGWDSGKQEGSKKADKSGNLKGKKWKVEKDGKTGEEQGKGKGKL